MWWYNLGMHSYNGLVRVAGMFNGKARLWADGRHRIFDRMSEAISPTDRIVWMHCASLGEFEQGRPLLEAIRREHPEYKLLLTFFSPSGYEIRKDCKGADYIFYLPMDTPHNVRLFLDIAHPEIAIFIKYEFWLNYLMELGRRNISTYIVSAIFRPDSIFFGHCGGAFRKALKRFSHLFVQDERSKQLLAGIGMENVTVTGDTRFDRVAEIAASVQRLPIVENFSAHSRVLVAGSTWSPDEEILIQLINANPDTRFIVAPHEMHEERISILMNSVKGGAVRYSQSRADENFAGVQLLVIDTIGILSSVYSYGHFAYVGGGFGVGIHNTLEPATFGVPIAFGPNYHKFKEASDLIFAGAARSVLSAEELLRWFSELQNDEASYQKAAAAASDYIASNRGATEVVMREIFP